MAGLETKHGLLLIGDGLGDRPVPELDGQTPLGAGSSLAGPFLAWFRVRR